MGLLSPITDFGRGFKTYLVGLRWLLSHPKYLLLVLTPMFLGFVALWFSWGFLNERTDVLYDFVLFAKPESWWGEALYYVARFTLYISSVILLLIIALLGVNIISSPFYELTSLAVERDLTGRRSPELSFWQSIKIMKEELKKVLFILVISIAFLFVPGLNVISILVTAFFVGWDFYDYPLARRGWSFFDRLLFIKTDAWAVAGFGLWLAIPFLQYFLMPFAVAGGTILSVEALEKRSNIKELIHEQS